MARQYSPEVGRQVIELARAGPKVKQLARTFQMSDATIYTWLKQDRIDRGEAEPTTRSITSWSTTTLGRLWESSPSSTSPPYWRKESHERNEARHHASLATTRSRPLSLSGGPAARVARVGTSSGQRAVRARWCEVLPWTSRPIGP